MSKKVFGSKRDVGLVVLGAVAVIIGLLFANFIGGSDGAEKVESVEKVGNEYALTRLNGLANGTIGAVMATLDYADDERVIFHYGYGLIVYSIEHRQVKKGIDLEKLGVPFATQGDEVISVTVNDDGTEVYITGAGSGNKEYVYNVDEDIVREGHDMSGQAFKALFDVVGDERFDDGWYSNAYAKTPKGIDLALVLRGGSDVADILLVGFDGKEKIFELFAMRTIPPEDGAWQEKPYEGEVKISEAEAISIAKGSLTAISAPDAEYEVSAELVAWTHGGQLWGDEVLAKIPEIAERGYPKDAPVYMVEFGGVPVHGGKGADFDRDNTTVNQPSLDEKPQFGKYLVVIDANNGIELLYSEGMWEWRTRVSF